jgi:hypothetical protein
LEAGLTAADVEEQHPMPKRRNPCHAGRKLSKVETVAKKEGFH